MTRMRVVFMGTPVFATGLLRELHDRGHELVAVYTQPPRPAGRGMELKKSPVHLLAESLGLKVFTPRSLRAKEDQAAFAALAADVAVVAAYGLILPREILEAPKYGCLNLHGSLLPRWRGAAPIQRAIMAGDTETGVGVMQEFDADGLLATVVQHELEHLEGGLFIDHLSRLKRERVVKKFTKAARHGARAPERQTEDA